MQKFKNGSTVYVNGTWNIEEKCEVLDFFLEECTGMNIYKLRSKVNGGTFGVTEDCVFATQKEAHEAYIQQSKNQTIKYKEEIKNLKDLIEFPFTHCFFGEEYKDYEAIDAYKERAKEILGMEIV